MKQDLLPPLESLKIIEQHCESRNVFYKYKAEFSNDDEDEVSFDVPPLCEKEIVSKEWILAELCFRAFAVANVKFFSLKLKN